MKALCPMDQKLLCFIRAHMEAHGLAPSIKEMRIALGYQSNSYAHHRLETLIDAGYVKRTVRGARGLELVQTKDYHLPDCCCRGCSQQRDSADLRLVQALHVAAPVSLRLRGLRPLNDIDRILWTVGGFPEPAAPRTRTAIPGGGR